MPDVTKWIVSEQFVGKGCSAAQLSTVEAMHAKSTAATTTTAAATAVRRGAAQ